MNHNYRKCIVSQNEANPTATFTVKETLTSLFKLIRKKLSKVDWFLSFKDLLCVLHRCVVC